MKTLQEFLLEREIKGNKIKPLSIELIEEISDDDFDKVKKLISS